VFLAGLRLAKLLLRHQPELARIVIAQKGTRLHQELRESTVEATSAIVIVPTYSQRENLLEEARQIVRNLVRSGRPDLRVIFLGNRGSGLGKLSDINVKSVVVRLGPAAEERITAALAGAGSLAASAEHVFASDLSKLMLQSERGSAAFVRRVASMLSSGADGSSDADYATGEFLLAFLAVLLVVPGRASNAGVVERAYKTLADELSRHMMLADFGEARDLLQQCGLVDSAESLFSNPEASAAAEDAVLELIQAQRQLALLAFAALYWTLRDGCFVNTGARLFESHLPVHVNLALFQFVYSKDEDLGLRLAVAFGVAERCLASLTRTEEIEIVLREISQRSSDLLSIEDFIAFQMIYRIVRDDLEQNQGRLVQARIGGTGNPVVALGILEAVASRIATVGGDVASEEDRKLLLSALTSICERNEERGAPSASEIMALDILWYYGSKAPLLLSIGRDHYGDGAFKKWMELADAVRRAEAEEGAASTILESWKSIRRNFVLIQDATPPRFKRTKPTVVL
jgi:hypothetical protein